jgi:hypothetical protein
MSRALAGASRWLLAAAVCLGLLGRAQAADWTPVDGVHGVPALTFTLPASLPGKITSDSIYLADIQATFPEVDWARLDRLYLRPGHYRHIFIGNLPQRSADRRLVITNQGGQVRVGGLGHYYLLKLAGGANWVLSGRYDPVSLTGDPAFPGHRGGAFANSQGRYGIVVDDEFAVDGNSGVAIGGRASAFELEYLEIARVGFAGVLAKTDNDGTATMAGVSLHDLYIHDTGSEGLYIGSRSAQPQHAVRDWKIFNNRVLRTGTEAIQISQLQGRNEVRHNVFGPAAIDWRAAFQPYQDHNLQIGFRAGELHVHDNLFIGAGGNMISMFMEPVAGDPVEGNRGVRIENNYFSDMRNLGLYLNHAPIPGTRFDFVGNTWRAWRFERDQVYTDAVPYDHLLRTTDTTTPTRFIGSGWAGPPHFSNLLPTGDGSNGNVSGKRNQRAQAQAVRFVDAGLPAGFDYLRLEMWTDVATRGTNQPVTYGLGFVVTHLGLPYRCKLDPCPAGAVPPQRPDAWLPLAPFADDVRVLPGSRYEALGLQPQ